MLLEIGFGLICGSVCSLISPLSSSFSLRKSFIAACKTLNLSVKAGDTVMLPAVNAQYNESWGIRLLCGLPVGLSSTKVIDQKRAIAEAMRVDPDDVEMTYKNDGLVIDIVTQPMPEKVSFEMTVFNDYRVPIGVNRKGEARYYDFDGPYPHLLIGGISGGGKSVIVRGILASLATGPAPDLFLCDLKGGVELGIFRELACVKGFATSLSDVLRTATEIESEMNRRYSIMAANGSQTWEGKKAILVIDELADFKVRPNDPDKVVKSSIKTKLTVLSAKGRAAGVLLVLATQRPSADVIDGLIKTNIAASICFRTRDGTQSRIVLDHDGAAALPDVPGRLIFQTSKDETLQAPFLSAEEAKRVIADLPKKEPIVQRLDEQRKVAVTRGTTNENATKAGPMDSDYAEL
ncbi:MULTISPECIES: FtsK/SpoIIIE domain-containing protein [unclassified Paenibacillus]|uniref:FtsK/SpoIIIE domain-containing protein n=1 Tax=unclassified Paenibacillus TaxID=185978 RepID=UPI00362B2828